MAHLELSLSGRTINVHKVELYRAGDVNRWRGLVAAAQQKMGGFSTGIGFLGSPQWAIGGALALGALESLISSASQKDGLALLGQAATLLDQIRSQGRMISVSDIAHISLPNPAAWQGETRGGRRLVYSRMPNGERRRIEEEFGLTKADVEDGYLVIPATIAWVALDGPFINVLPDDDQQLSINWASVETYRLLDPLVLGGD